MDNPSTDNPSTDNPARPAEARWSAGTVREPPSGPDPDGGARTPAPSLRRRVTLATLGLLAVLLALVGVALDVTLGAQVDRGLHDRLVAAGSRADALATAGTPPARLVAEVSGGTVRALLVTASGLRYGDPAIDPDTAPGASAPLPPPVPPRPPDGGPAPAPPPVPPDGTATVVVHPLRGGGRVILVADTTQATQVRRDLRELMLAAGLITLVVAAFLLSTVARRALRPLDRLTEVARDITEGDRGRRVRPDREDTDLGHAAAAFDAMLDALEDTERRARDAAADARASAEHARRAEAGTRRFLADAAHELRTPLAGMHAAAEQLATHDTGALAVPHPAAARAGSDASRRRRRVELLLADLRRASRLVRDMLDLSRIDAGLVLETEHVDLVRIARGEVERAALLAPSLTVVRTGDQHLPVRGDPTRLAQVLSNLLDNARRHTPPGGTITLHMHTAPTGPADLPHPGPGAAGDIAVVTVTDTGTGIPAADRDRVFDRLVRLDDSRHRDHGGAGLGLPIARALAEAHGGTLRCLPHEHGARFELRLPAPGPR
jgi:two-component system, OmpR family, sensor kinase